jgi:hypothetical protein
LLYQLSYAFKLPKQNTYVETVPRSFFL